MPKKTILEDQGPIIDQKITLPKHNSRWVWLVLLLVIIIAAGAWYYLQGRSKVNITDYQSCVAAGGAIPESFPEQCVKDGLTFVNPDQKLEEPVVADEEPETEEPKLASYNDSVNGFNIQYPADFLQSEQEILAPYVNSEITITSQAFSHTIPIQYCDAKGDCVPNTTDISLGLSVVNSSVDTIAKSPKMAGIKDIKFGDNTFKTLSQGAEGEGIYYYFISLPNKKTLMVTRTYIDETVITSYKDKTGFITKADQDKLAEQVLMSLSFGASILNAEENKDWVSYTNTKWSFSLKHPKDWKIYEKPQNLADPIINIYKSGTPPFIHHSGETHASIFPQGVGTEGKIGEAVASLDFPAPAQATKLTSYLLNSKTHYAYYISGFASAPANWEDYGFIWGSTKPANYQSKCQNKQGDVNEDKCGLGGDPTYTLTEQGTISETDAKIVRTILSSSKFTK